MVNQCSPHLKNVEYQSCFQWKDNAAASTEAGGTVQEEEGREENMHGCHVTGTTTKLLRHSKGARLINPRRVPLVDTKYTFILCVFLII